MHLVDTNIVLRYLLQDHDTLSEQATALIDNHLVFASTEVVAEVCYVLAKVYQLPRAEIANELFLLFNDNIIAHVDRAFILHTIHIYEQTRLDFVDCAMIGYHQSSGYRISSFDKKINRYVQRQSE